MKFQRLAEICRADFFSPKDFVRHAILIIILFLGVHLAGLREFTSILNGTSGSVELGPDVSAVLGAIYLLAYLGLVLLVPMLLLAAALLAGWRRWKAGESAIKQDGLAG